jgi:serine phosphatase RsbU (regulator of sigma subunit)
MATAGHPPPLIVRAGGDVDQADATGLLLGVARDAQFGQMECVLERGDTLVLYTDGATELPGPDLEHGEWLMREQLARMAGRPPREIVEGIERAALVASGGALRDDLALMALQVPST